MSKIFAYLLTYRMRVMLSLVCLLIGVVANLSSPFFIKQIIDKLGGTGERHADALTGLILLYGATYLFGALCRSLQIALIGPATQGIIRTMAFDVLGHIYRLPARFHVNRDLGAMVRDIDRGNYAVTYLAYAVLQFVAPLVIEILFVLGWILYQYGLALFFAVLATVAIFGVFNVVYTIHRIEMVETLNDLESAANSTAIDGLINVDTVKYFGNEQHELDRYDTRLAAWEYLSIKNESSISFSVLGQGVIIAFGMMAVMLLACRQIGDGRMTIGSVVMLNALMIQLYTPLRDLGILYREIRRAIASLDRMLTIFHQPVEPQIGADINVVLRAARSPEISFQQVSFGYTDTNMVLHDIDFHIGSGETVAIVGESGSGKSTLQKLLFRLYEPTAGCILIDGQGIACMSLAQVRSMLGVVPQETMLFNDTIAYNIGYGEPNARIDRIHQAAIAANLHDFVSTLPQGYETVVGERGIKLSGGERQRIGIARAILRQPPILLLDEATSALDSKNESEIQHALNTLTVGRTTIVIAHRLSTIAHADKIIVLQAGRIVESGSHQVLLNRRGVYAEMLRRQNAMPGVREIQYKI